MLKRILRNCTGKRTGKRDTPDGCASFEFSLFPIHERTDVQPGGRAPTFRITQSRDARPVRAATGGFDPSACSAQEHCGGAMIIHMNNVRFRRTANSASGFLVPSPNRSKTAANERSRRLGSRVRSAAASAAGSSLRVRSVQ